MSFNVGWEARNKAAIAALFPPLRQKRLPFAIHFFADNAAIGMVIDEPHGLHKGVNRRGSDELPAAFF